MKILHLTTDDFGGAGRAALRLHQALLKQGIDSQVLVQNKKSDFSQVQCLTHTKKQKILAIIRSYFDQIPLKFYVKSTNEVFSSAFFPKNRDLIKVIEKINPDLIHIHWINAGFINPSDLLNFNKPIFWSLHDTNPFTGGCHYPPSTCTNFLEKCGKCPFLQSNFRFDLSFLNYKKKEKQYKKIKNMTINGLSRWITSEAYRSSLFKDKKIINLPNTIDTQFYRPIDQRQSRKLLNIPNDGKIIIGFGAISATQDIRKGYTQLLKILTRLPNKNKYRLVVFGSNKNDCMVDIETIFLGHLYDDLTLMVAYNTLDLFIVPSLVENLSNTIMESLSCGVPVVAFDTGGNIDLIDHKKNGFLAQNLDDMLSGISWCIANRKEISQRARKKIDVFFNYQTVANQYIDAYNKILKK